MATWVALSGGIAMLAMLATVVLFASGILYARPSVVRLISTHDAEVSRLISTHEAALGRAIEDCSYYRKAAQSCAAAVAHREGQVKMLEAMLQRQAGDQT